MLAAENQDSNACASSETEVGAAINDIVRCQENIIVFSIRSLTNIHLETT